VSLYDLQAANPTLIEMWNRHMKIFYMNQGGGGHWGAVRYSGYDLLLLAEWGGEKQNFEMVYRSTALPTMSIQAAVSGGRMITAATDLDTLSKAVRPVLTFQITSTNIRVVFCHLKSGSANLASEELGSAVHGLTTRYLLTSETPILWVGDFNRAEDKAISARFGCVRRLFEGGGESKWYLDRVLATGTWTKNVAARKVTVAGADHNHQGIEITIQ